MPRSSSLLLLFAVSCATTEPPIICYFPKETPPPNKVLKGSVLIDILEFYPTPNTAQSNTTERAVESVFAANEFRVVDESGDAWTKSFSPNSEDEVRAAAALAYRSSAAHLLLGQASQDGPSQLVKSSSVGVDVFVVQARVEIKLIRTDNGQILFADTEVSKGADATEDGARQRAFQVAAESLAKRLTVQVGFAGCDGVTGTSSVVALLVVPPAAGFSLREAMDLQRELSAIPGIDGVVLREFSVTGEAPFELYSALSIQEIKDTLQRALTGKRLIAVEGQTSVLTLYLE
jgi:hypothetical protein